MRSLAPRQITDLEGLGLRLDIYAQIREVPGLGGQLLASAMSSAARACSLVVGK